MKEMKPQGFQLNTVEAYCLRKNAEERYGLISPRYLMRSLDVVYSSLAKFSRVCAIRVDLRFAQEKWGGDPDLPTCFQRTDPQAMTRFIESLKSQLRGEHQRKGRRGEPALFEYVWVREQDRGDYPHYHLVLLFNKDEYAFLGDYRDPDANNMATRIQKAWCSALGLHYPDYTNLVHFPQNAVYAMDRRSATVHSESYLNFLMRIAYLAKKRTKDIADGYRHFGCSQ